ncbi:hypothetical protein Q1695_003457 [Nippostrongylus brasiliensis]|nr:hypothetical protein Q1695_003457 [Nippostrongylus brasiliensis]
MIKYLVTSYLLRILLSKRGPRHLRRLIWRKQTLALLATEFEDFGSIVVHPLDCLCRGLIDCQIVELTVTFKTWQGQRSQITRLFLLRTSPAAPLHTVGISRIDAFNLFGRIPAKEFVVDRILAYRSLPKLCRTLSPTDCIRVATIKSADNEEVTDLTSQIGELLKSPRIVYTNDVISIPVCDLFTRKITYNYLKVFCEDSPCIVDTTTSVYQIASVNTYLPYSGKPKGIAIPPPMEALVERMRNVCLAHEAVASNPLVLLLSGGNGSGKRLLSSRLAADTHRNLLEVSCIELWSESVAQSEAKLRNAFEKAKSYQPAILLLTSVDVLGYDAATNAIDPRLLSTLRSILSDAAQLVVIFSCNSSKVPQLSSSLLSLVLYDFVIEPFDENDRRSFFSTRLPADLAQFAARRTAGFVIAELIDLLRDVEFRVGTENADRADVSHLEWAIDKRNANFADAIGAPKIPTVSWDDVGGFEDTKRVIIESIEANLHGRGLTRSGIMLFGPPGCGKTLIAKAVASEFKIAFLSVKGPELLNKYVGQSEENVRRVFERARQASPCVIFFDELDSLVPNRGRSGDSGGVMDRIVSQLIAELDSLHSTPHIKVFVMAATNRADLIDPALMTPGRFDKVIHVAPGTDVESKTKVLKALTRKVKLADDIDLREVASQCDGQTSGAEMYSVVSQAAMESIREQIEMIESGTISPSDVKGVISRTHFQSALEKKRRRS